MNKKIKWTPEAREILHKLALLPPERFVQKRPIYREKVGCCFGAHLAKEWDSPNYEGYYNWDTGRYCLAKNIGIDLIDLDNCLRAAGTQDPTEEPRSAFGSTEWYKPVWFVIAKFLEMTHVPETV